MSSGKGDKKDKSNDAQPAQDEKEKLLEAERIKAEEAKAKAEKEFEEKLKKFKVDNKYDPYTLKASLDDCITDILTEEKKMVEDHRHSNRKILMGFLITVTMIVSHFYPLPFPDNYYLLIGCVVFYGIVSTIFNYYESKIVKDSFLLCKIPKGNQDDKEVVYTPVLSFESKIEMYSEFYEIKVIDYNQGKQLAQRKVSVEKFYDTEGKISYGNVKNLLNDLLVEIRKKSL